MRIRIIGGERKGKKLRPIQGKRLRPTSGRLRETIFNVIAERVPGARVLDMFAGTGALGIEALSRGAEFCVFMDINVRSLSLIGKNVHDCGFEERTKIIKWNARKNLDRVKNASPPFDLAFLDPPYGRDLLNPALSNLGRSLCLSRHAIVIAEHLKNEPISELSAYFEAVDERRYGKTVISFMKAILP